MVKTDLTGINGVSRSLLHSKITRQQQAINLLSETGSNRRDSLSISDSARSFSKKSIAALIDKSTNVSASELSFYFANYDNSGAFWMQSILGRTFPADIIRISRSMV